MKLFKKMISSALTVILVCSTILCIVVMFKSIVYDEVSIFGHSIYYIVTGSMEPTIPQGSICITKKVDANELIVNDVITYRMDNGPISGFPNTHRIIEVLDGNSFRTKGDSNLIPDDDLVSEKQILGKVVFYTKKLAFIATFLSFLSTPMGFLFTILVPLALITVYLLKDFTKKLKDEINEIKK